ncbi:unnamed protein product [Mytilus coruscus]|nr:unnamed protein product [Mytilus coruscus]
MKCRFYNEVTTIYVPPPAVYSADVTTSNVATYLTSKELNNSRHASLIIDGAFGGTSLRSYTKCNDDQICGHANTSVTVSQFRKLKPESFVLLGLWQ